MAALPCLTIYERQQLAEWVCSEFNKVRKKNKISAFTAAVRLRFCCVIWLKTMLSQGCRAERLSHFAAWAKASNHAARLSARGTKWWYVVAAELPWFRKKNKTKKQSVFNCIKASECNHYFCWIPLLDLENSKVQWWSGAHSLCSRPQQLKNVMHS